MINFELILKGLFMFLWGLIWNPILALFIVFSIIIVILWTIRPVRLVIELIFTFTLVRVISWVLLTILVFTWIAFAGNTAYAAVSGQATRDTSTPTGSTLNVTPTPLATAVTGSPTQQPSSCTPAVVGSTPTDAATAETDVCAQGVTSTSQIMDNNVLDGWGLRAYSSGTNGKMTAILPNGVCVIYDGRISGQFTPADGIKIQSGAGTNSEHGVTTKQVTYSGPGISVYWSSC